MMKKRMTIPAAALIMAAACLSASPAFADPPPGKGRDKAMQAPAGNHGSNRGGGSAGSGINIDIVIGDSDRAIIRDYYGNQFRQGRCPPGLAKKNNGCMPPGQAKKWMLGRPLPRDVTFHDLPRDLLLRLKLPPEGYRYVRVAADILMIAVGTGIVAAAVEDLSTIS